MPEPIVEGKSAPSASPFRTYASDVAKLTGKPLPKNVANVPAPPPAHPAGPPPAPIIPKAPSTNETGDEVLERLRPAAPTPVAVPPIPRAVPVAPPTPSVIAPAFTPSPPLTPPVLPPPPPGIPPLTKVVPASTPSPIHTYRTDFKAHQEDTGFTRIGMVAAEEDAKGMPARVVFKEEKKSNKFLFAAGAVLVLAGIGSVYAAYQFAIGNPAIPEEAFVPSLIFADERIALEGSGEELRQALAEAAGKELPDHSVAIVYITYSTTTEAGIIEEIASGRELFNALRLPAPDILLRNIEPPSTPGVINAGGETRPFFILRVSSFERTYAGMLSWEPTMERDLLLFYPPHPALRDAATTTSTSTAPFRLSFVDEVIENRDVRVLRDADDRVVMLYGYRDKETLIIARSTAAFSELLERLSSTRVR